VVSPDGSRVYVIMQSSKTVKVINTLNHSLLATVPVGSFPTGIAVSPNGSRVYVANQGSNNISVINTATNTVDTTVTVGSNPYGLSVSPDGSKVYVANNGSNNVSVINTTTNTEIARVSVGQSSPTGVSVSPDGNRVYVANSSPFPNGPNYVSVINTASNSVITNIGVGISPNGLSVSPDGNRVYVANNGSNNVSVINTATHTVDTTVQVGASPFALGNFIKDGITCTGAAKTFTITVHPTPGINQPDNQVVCNGAQTAPVNFGGTVAGSGFIWTNTDTSIGLAANSFGSSIPSFNAINTGNTPKTATVKAKPYTVSKYFAYISNSFSFNVSVIPTATNTVTATVPVGFFPVGVSVSSNGSRVYVTNFSVGYVLVINTATNTVIAGVTVGSFPYGLSVSPGGNRVYVANSGSNSVSVINATTNTVGTTVPVGSNPYGVAVSPDSSWVYVANNGSNNVSVINTATHTVDTTVQVGSAPVGIAVSPDGRRVYVANSSSHNVSVINTADNSVITVPAGSNPYGVSVSPNGSRVYVTNDGSNNVSVINTATNTMIAMVPVGSNPRGLSVSPDANLVYVANYGSNNVSVINTATNTVIATVPVGTNPTAFGNFIKSSPADTCTGTTKTFTITVNPTPNARANLVSPTICSDSVISIDLTGDVAGTTFNWTRDNTVLVTGIGVSGSGNISGSLTNTTNLPITVTFTITPGFTNAGVTCTGAPITITVLVNPKPNALVSQPSQTICSGIPINTIGFTGNVSGTTFNWIRDNAVAVTGIAASGSGNITGSLTNTTNAPVTVTFTITPVANGCPGTPITATVLVNPTPAAVAAPASQTKCSGIVIDTIILGGNNPVGTIYTWTRDNIGTVTGIGSSGIGNISGTLTNTTNVPITVTFTILPTYTNSGMTCTGATITATVLVNPNPGKPGFIWLNLSNGILCKGSDNINFNVIAPVNNVSYLWSSSPSSVSIKDNNDANTVISFQDTGAYNVKVNAINNVTGCSNADSQIVTISSTAGIDKRRIFLKQPGNLLIYPDNSMDFINGYQWGYDSLLRTNPDRAYSAPIPVLGQVYQFFIPGSRFITGSQLDTVTRAFWVLLRKGDCYSRVYYNGPYSFARVAPSPPDENTIRLKLVPNPNAGVFDLNLDGNIYGDIQATIYNALGQPVFTLTFSKTALGIRQRFNTGQLPGGLYYLKINSSDLKRAQTRFIIQR
jgi:YVTN family beta-propeller protein